MDYKHQSSLTDTKADNGVIRSGSVNLRKRRALSGTIWKPRRLELHNQTLTIINVRDHCGRVSAGTECYPNQPVNNKRTRIELRDISEVERSDLSDHCLRLKAKERVFNFSFATETELYDWQDDVYQRCPLGNYSAPFDFVHKSHIGSDNVTGQFTVRFSCLIPERSLSLLPVRTPTNDSPAHNRTLAFFRFTLK